MKKDENSGVSIKQIMVTTIFLTVATLGGLNAYRIVYSDNANTIQEIESASLETNEILNFETALVENTKDDVVYSEDIKYLAVKVVDSVEETHEDALTENAEKVKNNTNFSEKVVSRGTYARDQVLEKTTTNAEQINNQNKLLNAVINEIKEFGEKQENIIEMIGDTGSKSGEVVQVNDDMNDSGDAVESGAASIAESVVKTDVQPLTSPLTPPTEYVKTIDVKATAYCLCKKCCGKSPSNPNYGVTASGLKILPGEGMKVVASDPRVIPLGTEVYIEGLYGAKDYGYAIVADTGSAIKNLKIDLYMDTHQMALNWGVKSVRVYILDK